MASQLDEARAAATAAEAEVERLAGELEVRVAMYRGDVDRIHHNLKVVDAERAQWERLARKACGILLRRMRSDLRAVVIPKNDTVQKAG